MKKSNSSSFSQLTVLSVAAGILMGLSPVSSVLAVSPKTVRASVSSTGSEGNSYSESPALTANGRNVAFASEANNLVDDDGNDTMDVFVHDLLTGKTQRVSVDSAGVEGNGPSFSPAFAADGSLVAFASGADNLVAGDNNNTYDVFVRNLKTGVTSRISVDSSGMEGNGSSSGPSFSANGRFVAFLSYASNLVAEDGNGTADVFVHDLKTGITQRASVDSSGTEGNGFSYEPVLSENGRYVAFSSYASNLVSGDNNGTYDVFVRDLVAGETQRVSVGNSGIEGNNESAGPAISGNGRYVAFHSKASNLVEGDGNYAIDVFVRDLKKGVIERISLDSTGVEGNSTSLYPAISANGRYIAFHSTATNLIPGDDNVTADVFVRDLRTDSTEMMSLGDSGVEGNSTSIYPAISGNGRFVAFETYADNLTADDTNEEIDIFVRRR
ncbi:TolB family protein [Methylosarcina fibrata]|uniref:TolB family protein n=1 Tax=Methylosarcina fibrata TaxID=105972 RepID=UPI000A0000EE|nr:PD40 domain-containing protein [Methylosarcina fibrata]